MNEVAARATDLQAILQESPAFATKNAALRRCAVADRASPA
ncbi:hypothetical protein [Methylocella sp.]